MPYTVLRQAEIEDRIARKVADISDVLGLADDYNIAILRHFDWDQAKVEEKWFEDETLPHVIGIEYNPAREKDYPELTTSLQANNNGMCPVMYDEFDKDDLEMKAVSLSCGH